jgi:hypothetical protein
MAWFNGNLLTRTQLVDALNAAFPELNLQWDDVEIIDDAWTIDGIEPLMWCKGYDRY